MLPITGMLYAYAIRSFTDLSFALLTADFILFALLLGGIDFLFCKTIRFGRFSSLSKRQKWLNYTTLHIISLSLWLLLAWLAALLLYQKYQPEIVQTLMPIRLFTAILLHIIFTLWVQIELNRDETVLESDSKEEIIDEIADDDENSTVETIDRIALKSGNNINLVAVDEIVYIRADGDYVQIFTSKGKHLKEETMKYFEAHLPPSCFLRIHRSYIVNLEKILRIELYDKNRRMIRLSNGDKIVIGAAGYKRLREKLAL